MTPSAMPMAKNFIRGISRSDAKQCLRAALDKEDAEAVKQLLRHYFEDLPYAYNTLDLRESKKSGAMSGAEG